MGTLYPKEYESKKTRVNDFCTVKNNIRVKLLLRMFFKFITRAKARVIISVDLISVFKFCCTYRTRSQFLLACLF